MIWEKWWGRKRRRRLTEALQAVLPPIPISDMVIAGPDVVVEVDASPALMAIAVEVELGWSDVAVDCICIIMDSSLTILLQYPTMDT